MPNFSRSAIGGLPRAKSRAVGVGGARLLTRGLGSSLFRVQGLGKTRWQGNRQLRSVHAVQNLSKFRNPKMQEAGAVRRCRR